MTRTLKNLAGGTVFAVIVWGGICIMFVVL